MAKKSGRPTKYTDKLADEICAVMAVSDKGLPTLCRMNDTWPEITTIRRWVVENRGAEDGKEGFRDKYMRAKDEQAEWMTEDMIDIADDGRNDTYVDEDGNVRVDNDVIQRSRLRIETRKWIASKLKPKKYGDKLDLTSDGEKLPPPVTTVKVIHTDKKEASDGDAGQ